MEQLIILRLWASRERVTVTELMKATGWTREEVLQKLTAAGVNRGRMPAGYPMLDAVRALCKPDEKL